jgi:hypothetical protein
MKKIFLYLCLSTSLAHAMDKDLSATNVPTPTTPSVNINSPSLGNKIINTVGNSGSMALDDPNPDNFFTVMGAIVKAREEARMAEEKKLKYAAISLGLLTVFAVFKTING